MNVVEGAAEGMVSKDRGGSAGKGTGNEKQNKNRSTIYTMARKWGRGRILCPPHLPQEDENDV